MAPVPKSHRGQPRGANVLHIKVLYSTVLELQAEAELGVTVFNSQEIPGTNMFILISDSLAILVLAAPGQL